MDRQLPFAGALRGGLVAAALVAWWPSTVSAQSSLPAFIAAVHVDKPAAAPAAPLPAQLAEAREQLDRAVQSRGEAGKGDAARQDQPLQADKLRLLDWLVDLQREKTRRLEELEALQAAPKSSDEDPLVKMLQGPPPHSAIQVDALRDEIDALRERIAALDGSYRANETELQNLHDQLKIRAAVARRTGEAPFGSRSAAEAGKVQGERDLANLREKIAEVEIAVLALDQQRLGLQTSALRGRIEELQAVVVSVLPDQQLSREDLAAQRQRIGKEEARLEEEIQRVRSRNSRRLAERGRLDHADAGQQASFLDRAIKIDNAILKGLDHLQMLNGISGDAWEKRYSLLNGADSEQKRIALDVLAELRQKLADWRTLSRTRQDALRTDIRAQRVRVDNLAANRPDQAHENQLLDLLLQQTATDERVELSAARLEKQVSRWLDDLTGSGNRRVDGRLGRLADAAASLAIRVWQQELFVVEDASEVDGRQVSVKYGVTVGKSVGLLVVFVVGYWLLAMVSRFIQHQLVRWFKISPQLASVMRRWSMIGLSFVLVVLLLNLARIPLSVFAFAGGALAIGVGFGAQTVIKNFISGLIVLFERKVRVGDIVELGGVTGHVTAVDLRATTVRGFDGVEALIPNANFVENQVVNWTYSNQRSRREIKIGIAYGSDLAKVEGLFLATAASHLRVLRDPAPEVFFEDFGDSALTVVLVYWVELDGPVSPRRVASDLRFRIYESSRRGDRDSLPAARGAREFR